MNIPHSKNTGERGLKYMNIPRSKNTKGSIKPNITSFLSQWPYREPTKTTYDNQNKFLVRFEFFVYISMKNFANRKHAQHSSWTWTMTLYFVTVQACTYGEAAYIPGTHRKDRSLWCMIETHFKISVYHNWPPHVNMFCGGALKINPNKVYILRKLNKRRIWLRFFFFWKDKSSLNFAQRSDIYPFLFSNSFIATIIAAMCLTSQMIRYTLAFKRVSLISQRSLRFLFIQP